MRELRRRRFSFLEVLVAVAILGLAVSLAVSIMGTVRQRLVRNQEAWAREHVLTQVLEYHRLYGHRAPPPSWLIPQGFVPSCELEPVADDAVSGGIRGWRLYRLRVGVRNAAGETVGERSVEVLWREEDWF